jgi:ribonuclease PH
LMTTLAASSVGLVHGYMMLDLCYDEDCNASADFNIAMTEQGEFVEIQGTAEAKPFSRETIKAVLTLAEQGIRELFQVQKEALQLS